MNKTVIIFSASVFGIVGSLIPQLWGDKDFFSGMSILMSTVGGLVGIVVGVWISNRWLS